LYDIKVTLAAGGVQGGLPLYPRADAALQDIPVMARPGLEPGTPRFSEFKSITLCNQEIPANMMVLATLTVVLFSLVPCGFWRVKDVGVVTRPFRCCEADAHARRFSVPGFGLSG
jgi:hypothetical protein